MTRRALIIALLLTMGAMIPAWADDRADCLDPGVALIKTEPAKVVSACRRLADQGSAPAQFNLGVLYERGLGVPQDYAEAVKWIRKAANQGYGHAQTNLGWMYQTGHGVPADYAGAAKWYRKSADQGDAYGQSNLGVMYANGQGVSQDYVQAEMWFTLAANQGNIAAAKNRDLVAAKMTPSQIEKAQALAAAWKPTTGQ